MNSTQIRQISEVIGHPVRRLSLSPFLTATASPLDFHHPDAALTQLRKRVPFSCGDYDLQVSVCLRDGDHDHDFLDFVASSVLLRAWDPEASVVTAAHVARVWGEYVIALHYPDPMMMDIQFPSPAHVLWQISCFGCLEWRPERLSWQHAAIARQASGEPIGQSPKHAGGTIWVETTPRLGGGGVEAVEAAAMERLEESARRMGMSRQRRAFTAQTIAEDCVDLWALCDAHGSFGRATFPQLADPCARAVQMMVPLNDGNTRDVYLETDDAWIALVFDTS